MPPTPPELSEVSREWLSEHPAGSRRALGQYLTPAPVAEALLDRVAIRPGMRVLDPGVGTGELLRTVRGREPGAELTGWDVDRSALAAAARLVPGATLVHRSALEPVPGEGGFDLVVGNPPYFQIRPTPEQKHRFREVISGRANVFAFFFQTGLDALRPGGRLAYIVPPSMNSGAYFEGLREHLVGRARITSLDLLDGADRFEGVNTAVQLLVLEKRDRAGERGDRAGERGDRAGQAGGGAGQAGGGAEGRGHPAVEGESVAEEPFVFERRSPGPGFRRTVFTPDPERFATQFEGRCTLWELGYRAATGTIVWNQHREALREVPGPDTVPLVRSHDLRRGGRRLFPGGVPAVGSRPGRPGYLAGCEPRHGPAILVNRVVGAVGRGELRTGFVPEGEAYLAENHVNVIGLRADREPGSGRPPGIGWEDLRRALEAPEITERIRLLTGNTQISATELTHLLPLS